MPLLAPKEAPAPNMGTGKIADAYGNAPGADAGTPGQLVASIYQKPDGTYCTEDASGTLTEFPDLASAAQSISDAGMDDMSAMPMEPDQDEASRYGSPA